MIIVVENILTGLKKELLVHNFTDQQINEILYFYVHRTDTYTAYTKE